jgi:hypothetical protein
MTKANGLRVERTKQELEVMRQVRVKRLPEYSQTRVRVTKWSTIRVKENVYSVPSRLRDEEVIVRIYDERIEVYFAGRKELEAERLIGRKRHRINYRHVIWSLVKKPGAFERYRYREDLFPSLAFRQAYDSLCEKLSARQADREYLSLLHLAASTMEEEVETAIELLLEDATAPMSHLVKDLVSSEPAQIPEMAPLVVDLSEYDELLNEEEAA